MTGFSPAALRVWETRHALLRPQRSSGGQRLYTDEDLQLLQRVRSLIDQGRSIGEVALLGREQLLHNSDLPDLRHVPPVDPELEDDRLATLQNGLVRAAVDLDAQALEHLLDEAFSSLSAPMAIHGVIEPAAYQIGEAWAAGRCSVAGEHIASLAFRRRLHGLMESSRLTATAAPRALCACLPDEQHDLGLLVVAYHLGRLGCSVLCLGAAVPTPCLEAAICRLAPAIVLLSVTRPELLDACRPQLLALVEKRSSTTRFILGGQGTNEERTEVGVHIWPASRSLAELANCLRLRSGLQE